MTVDRAALRKSVARWKPGMTVEVRVDELTELLDQLDSVETRLSEVQKLAAALVQLSIAMEDP